MKTDDSAARKLTLIGIALLVGATFFWETRDFIPSFAATHVTASAEVMTAEEPDDTHVRHAFKQAKDATRAEAQIETEPDPAERVRNATVTVRATTRDQALADITAMTDAMKRAFTDGGGKGELMVNSSLYTPLVPNGTLTLLSQVFRGLALLMALGGLASLYYAWRISGLPKQILWGGMIGIGICALYMVPEGSWSGNMGVAMIVMPIPVIITILVFVKMREARKAATWATGRAEIKSSKVRAERHRFAEDTTKVTNKAEVRYEFAVDGKTYTGTRISIGENPEGGVEAGLKRYAKGASVPVYYNPANPEECVLERDLPVSAGCMWTGAAVLMLLGMFACALIVNGGSIDKALSTSLPGVHHPLMALGVGLMGVFCIMAFFAGRRRAAQAASWPVTQGQIVSSEIESYVSSSDDSSTKTTMYQPVIEYSYKVGGQEYHCNTLDFGGTSASGSDAAAAKKVALYPVGMPVTVHYDPQNPGNAVLETKFGKGGCLLLIAALLFGVAIYAAVHP